MAESTTSQSEIAQRTSKRRGLYAAAAALVAGVVARMSPQRLEAGVDGDVVLRRGNTTGTTTSILNTSPTGTALDLFCPEGSTGVLGETFNSASYRLSGSDSSQKGAHVGLAGQLTNGWGMGSFRDSGYGISDSGGAAVVASRTDGAGGAAAVFYGLVNVVGNFTVVNGAKSAAVPHPDGTHRRLYCMESPQSWLEDFGKGQLECGQADVTIDPDFAAVVDLNDYQVFLTQYGGHDDLSVSELTPRGFRVEAKDATSTGRFGWRVVAKRKDIPAPRLETVSVPFEPRVQRR
jgi:hypothetical protein